MRQKDSHLLVLPSDYRCKLPLEIQLGAAKLHDFHTRTRLKLVGLIHADRSTGRLRLGQDIFPHASFLHLPAAGTTHYITRDRNFS